MVLVVSAIWLVLVVLATRQARLFAQDSHDLAILSQSRSDSSNLKRLVEERAATHQNINTYLIDKTAVLGFVEALEKLGKQIGVKVNIDQVNQNKDKLTVGVSVTGRFDAVWRYQRLLENLPWAFNLERADLVDNGQTETAEELWTGTFIGSALFRP